jgi:small conductance mechanosensitive channel
VLLSLRQPFAPNDAVIIEGFEGRITRLTARATILTTFDGNEVRIPNATVYKANIVNYTHTPERRFQFEIGIGYENDAACALALALNAVKSVDGVLDTPAPFTIIDRADAYSIVIKVFGWVNQKNSDFGKVKSEAIRIVLESLAAGNITLGEPVQNIRHLPDTPSGPARTATQPTSQELSQIKDTRADKVIVRKVEEIRSGDAEDLLAHGAPRE